MQQLLVVVVVGRLIDLEFAEGFQVGAMKMIVKVLLGCSEEEENSNGFKGWIMLRRDCESFWLLSVRVTWDDITPWKNSESTDVCVFTGVGCIE
ncbi:hypothetical protein RO3G_12695 [Rhizopus delemar RA 99-880]|uniref:Uncharacterized protein n=1 Tax=Rhizopus delemar (strain RA 99-880 / ATCC MYA-4621 / FGSC 9543 / NRRL 43880) TaxID=246409 RepID=I1CHQ4_RHIO9|nr:hypothetical protein RO3G_12695 [Rhizopus delemar RA 99-880]|eukprot:EIE87984.1 hypothetical protein RO3G_12695 [Rhizopus delemar RA 99-880]